MGSWEVGVLVDVGGEDGLGLGWVGRIWNVWCWCWLRGGEGRGGGEVRWEVRWVGRGKEGE